MNIFETVKHLFVGEPEPPKVYKKPKERKRLDGFRVSGIIVSLEEFEATLEFHDVRTNSKAVAKFWYNDFNVPEHAEYLCVGLKVNCVVYPILATCGLLISGYSAREVSPDWKMSYAGNIVQQYDTMYIVKVSGLSREVIFNSAIIKPKPELPPKVGDTVFLTVTWPAFMIKGYLHPTFVKIESKTSPQSPVESRKLATPMKEPDHSSRWSSTDSAASIVPEKNKCTQERHRPVERPMRMNKPTKRCESAKRSSRDTSSYKCMCQVCLRRKEHRERLVDSTSSSNRSSIIQSTISWEDVRSPVCDYDAYNKVNLNRFLSSAAECKHHRDRYRSPETKNDCTLPQGHIFTRLNSFVNRVKGNHHNVFTHGL